MEFVHQTPDHHSNWYQPEWRLSDFKIGFSFDLPSFSEETSEGVEDVRDREPV